MQIEVATSPFFQAFGNQLERVYELAAAPPTLLSGVSHRWLAVVAKRPSFALLTALQTKPLPTLPLSVATSQQWQHYLQVHPALAATWPGGTFAVAEVVQPTVWSGQDRASYLSGELFEASLLLAPALLGETAVLALQQRLAALAQVALPTNEVGATTVDQLAALQDELNRQLDRLPDAAWPPYFQHAPPETPLPDLHAIFKTEHDRVVLVFDKLTGEQLAATDWAALAAGLGQDCTGMQVVAVDQLQLLLAHEVPLDVVFKRYKLDWGHDPITAVLPQQANILRQAARLPLHILLHLLPQACLQATSEADWHKLIHDFQNKLLNVQLEHEILVRMGRIDRFIPPTQLPDRHAPTAERVDAIFSQLHDWVGFYMQQLAQVAAG